MSRRFPVTVRIGLGLLLMAAAGLKLYGLGVSAMPQVGWFAQPWVQLAVAEWELVLGLWLLSGSFPRASWLAAVGTFLAFAGVSGYIGFDGVASCGCLGAVQASPWWALAVDVIALLLLAVALPRGERVSSGSEIVSVKWAGGLVVLLVGATIAASAVYGSPEAALAWLRGAKLAASDIDMGHGLPGEMLEATVSIRNLSDRRIHLIGGTSDCSCTTLPDLPLSIEPGGAGAVGIRLRIPPGKTGQLTRTVKLRTDDSEQGTVTFRVVCRVD